MIQYQSCLWFCERSRSPIYAEFVPVAGDEMAAWEKEPRLLHAPGKSRYPRVSELVWLPLCPRFAFSRPPLCLVIASILLSFVDTYLKYEVHK